MKKELFYPYKEVIQRCILSCDNRLQLTCCYDMIDGFVNRFRYSVPEKVFTENVNELYDAYAAKDAEFMG